MINFAMTRFGDVSLGLIIIFSLYKIGMTIYHLTSFYNHTHGEGYFSYVGNTLEFEDLPRLTFKQFISFYNINPEKWFTIKNDNIVHHPTRIYQNNGQPICFKTVFDYVKYIKWIKKQVKNKKEKARDEKLQSIIDDVKKDINKINKDYENILTESTKTYLQIATRLKDDMKYYVDINEVNSIDTSKLYRGEPICIINSLTGKRKHYIWDGENFIFVKIF
jgi:hypothetical protein